MTPTQPSHLTRSNPLPAREPVTNFYGSSSRALPRPSTPTKTKTSLFSTPEYKKKSRNKAVVAASARAPPTTPSHSTLAPRATRSGKVPVEGKVGAKGRPAKRAKKEVEVEREVVGEGSRGRERVEAVEEVEEAEEDEEDEVEQHQEEEEEEQAMEVEEEDSGEAEGPAVELVVASLPSPPTTSRKRRRNPSPTPSASSICRMEPVKVSRRSTRANPAPSTPVKKTPTRAKAQKPKPKPKGKGKVVSEPLLRPPSPPPVDKHVLYFQLTNQGGTVAGPSRQRSPSPRPSQDYGIPAAQDVDEKEVPEPQDSEDEDDLAVEPMLVDDDDDGMSSGDDDPSTTPNRKRQSNRVAHLPISQKLIDATPPHLRNVLVGWHQLDALKTSPSAAIVARSSSGPRSPRTTKYQTEHVRELWAGIGSVLTGHSYPQPEQPEDGFDELDVSAWPCVPGYEEWERPIRYAMESVVEDGVGNCLIALGPRGVGKTMIVERSIKILENVYGVNAFIPVRLNGLVQTTDRQALRSIARQLECQGFDEEEGDWGSNAATMATLLRMLEPANDAATANKPVILIVDEFDLFALHPRQSFLYCLLDIVQGNRRKGGMGVIGLSSRTDCLSILEKRVRSRCQSQIHQLVLPNSLSDYLLRAKSLLLADVQAVDEEREVLAEEWNEEVEAFFDDSETERYFERLWRIHGSTPTRLLSALSGLYFNLERSAQHETADWASAPPSEMTIPTLDIKLLPETDASSGKRSDMLAGCTTLELTICVAAKYMRNEHDNQLNLEMLYDCYQQHVRRGKSGVAAKPFSKQAFAMALDSLRDLEVFLPHSGKAQHYLPPSLGDSFRMLKFVPWSQVVDDEISGRKDIPLPLRKWNKSWMD